MGGFFCLVDVFGGDDVCAEYVGKDQLFGKAYHYANQAVGNVGDVYVAIADLR